MPDDPANPANPTPVNPNPAPAASWRDTLPTELKSHPALGKLDSVEALAKEHVNVQALIGKKGVILPDDKATPEDWGKFWGALGRPEKADAYELKKPEGVDGYSEDFAAKFKTWAHEAGLTAKQAAALHDKYVADFGELSKAQATATAQSFEAGTAKLKEVWGLKYDENLEQANRVVKNFPGLADELKALKVQNSPALAQALALLGQLSLGEDSLVAGSGGGAGGGTLTPAQAQAEIDKIMAAARTDPKHAYMDNSHPEHKAMVQRVAQLFEMATVEKAA